MHGAEEAQVDTQRTHIGTRSRRIIRECSFDRLIRIAHTRNLVDAGCPLRPLLAQRRFRRESKDLRFENRVPISACCWRSL